LEKLVESFAWKVVALMAKIEPSVIYTTLVDTTDFSIMETLSSAGPATLACSSLKA